MSYQTSAADLIKHPSLQRLSFVLRHSVYNHSWTHNAPIYNTWERVKRHVNARGSNGIHASQMDDLLADISAVLAAICASDTALAKVAHQEDLLWIAQQVGARNQLALTFLIALPALGDSEFITAAEAAALTGDAESSWRKWCADGDVPGAQKQGKTWLIPHLYVEAVTN